MPTMAKIVPHLWYAKEAEEAAHFYTSIFPDSRIQRVTDVLTESPSGPAGSVKVVEFTLFSQPFMAISAGPMDPFNHAVSFMVNCDSQEEIDRYWDALLEGGKAEQCGWLRDKYGLCWQIVPTRLGELMSDQDKAKAKRVGERTGVGEAVLGLDRVRTLSNQLDIALRRIANPPAKLAAPTMFWVLAPPLSNSQ